MTLYVTLFVIFAGFVFTTIGAHPFPAKSATLILTAVPDIATNLSVDCTKINQMQKMTAGEIHRRLKIILLEVSLQQTLLVLTNSALLHSPLANIRTLRCSSSPKQTHFVGL